MTTDIKSLAEYKKSSSANRLGLWLFLLSDAFVFGGLLVALIVVKCHPGPSVEEPWLSHATTCQKYVRLFVRIPGVYAGVDILLAIFCKGGMLPKYTS